MSGIFNQRTKRFSNVLEEISLSVCGVHAPPVVRENVEDAQDDNEERGRPLGFEADGDHDTGGETKDGDEYARDAPIPLQNESDEKENEKDASSEKETA
jgi:hypothetical protein